MSCVSAMTGDVGCAAWTRLPPRAGAAAVNDVYVDIWPLHVYTCSDYPPDDCVTLISIPLFHVILCAICYNPAPNRRHSLPRKAGGLLFDSPHNAMKLL